MAAAKTDEGISEGNSHPLDGLKAAPWDPARSKDWDLVKPTEQCYLRIKRYPIYGKFRPYSDFLLRFPTQVLKFLITN